MGAGLNTAIPSLFLEGVVPYLDVDVLGSLCTAVRRVAADRSLFAISVGIDRVGDDPEATALAASFRARVAAVGEQVRTSLGPDADEALLGRCGWEVCDALELGPDAALAERRHALGLVLARATATS